MRTFFSELRRRNVVRVAIAYAAAGWVLVEVASVFFPIFNAPAWVLQVVALLVILGFPVALFLSWAFELTPEGIRRSEDVPHEESITRRTGRRLDFLIIGVLSAAVLYLVADKFFWQTAADAPASSAKSIAVLPFANRSPREEDAYFADGMHDELLTQLARIGSLKVISRTSVLRFRDTALPVQEIAKQLDVSTLLEGAVQRSADRVRINVKLIDADDESSIWAETYEHALTTDNVFAIQSDITSKISRALEVALTAEEERRAGQVPTANMEAYQAYLKARQLLPLRTVDALREGRRFAQRAVDLDPGFAGALALLADSLHLLHEYDGLPVGESLEPALALLDEALRIDPKLADAYAVLGEIKRHQQDFDAADAAFRKAIGLAPNDAQAHNWYSLLKADQGLPEEEFELTARAHELNPLHPVIHHNLAWGYFQQGRDEEALAEYARLNELHPDFPIGWLNQVWLHMRQGKPVEALRAMREHERIERESFANVYICRILVDLDHMAEARKCFDSFLARHPGNPLVLLESSYGFLAEGREEDARRALRQADAADDPESPMWVADDWSRILAAEAADAGDLGLARRLLSEAEPAWFTAADPEIGSRRLAAVIAAASSLLESGEDAQAKKLLSKATALIVARHRARGITAYGHQDVAVYALLGQHETAMRKLAEVAELPYLTDWRVLEYAPQFASLREDPRFAALLDDLRRHAREHQAIAAREGLLEMPTAVAAIRCNRFPRPADSPSCGTQPVAR